MSERLILTPCPPRKRCRICEARLNEVFGSADHTNKYRHQASEAGLRAVACIYSGDVANAVAFTQRAASFANLALNKGQLEAVA